MRNENKETGNEVKRLEVISWRVKRQRVLDARGGTEYNEFKR